MPFSQRLLGNGVLDGARVAIRFYRGPGTDPELMLAGGNCALRCPCTLAGPRWARSAEACTPPPCLLCEPVGESAGVSPFDLHHARSPRTAGQPADTSRRAGLVTVSSLHAAREVGPARWVLAGVSPFPVACCQQTHHTDVNEAVETRKEEKKFGEWTSTLMRCSGLAFWNCRELWVCITLIF